MKNNFSYIKDIIMTVVLLSLAFVVSLLFQYIFDIREHIPTVFVFATFLASLCTKRYLFGVLTSVIL